MELRNFFFLLHAILLSDQAVGQEAAAAGELSPERLLANVEWDVEGYLYLRVTMGDGSRFVVTVREDEDSQG